MTEEAFTHAVESTRLVLLEADRCREDRKVLLQAIQAATGDRPEDELSLGEQLLLAVARKVESDNG